MAIVKGLAIQAIRNEKGITQEQMANALGVVRPTVTSWETRPIVPPKRVAAIAEFLGVTIDELINRSVAISNGGTPQPLSGEAVSQELLNHGPTDALEYSIAVQDVAREFGVQEEAVLQLGSLSSNKEVRKIVALATPGRTVTDRMDKIRWNEALYLAQLPFKLKGVVLAFGQNYDATVGLTLCSKDDVLEWTQLSTIDDVWDDLLACPLIERYGSAEWAFRLKFPE